MEVGNFEKNKLQGFGGQIKKYDRSTRMTYTEGNFKDLEWLAGSSIRINNMTTTVESSQDDSKRFNITFETRGNADAERHKSWNNMKR